MSTVRLKVKRAVCRIVGHDWGQWQIEGRATFRTCRRCPAYEMEPI